MTLLWNVPGCLPPPPSASPTMANVQRPLKGSRISTFYPVKSLPPLTALDSAFQLQEFISLTIRSNIHDVSAIISVPDSRGNTEGAIDDSNSALSEEADGDKDTRSEFAVDEACWIYEQLRRLAQDLSHPLITMLQQECTRATCPEMKAGEWMYLCVAHGNDGAMEQCCAIDYILHTVDSATALLNSPRAFPSRYALPHEHLHSLFASFLKLSPSRRINIPPPSHRHFGSLARRLGRIFAHAYFHHREVFEQAEAESSLYARFLALTCKFDLVPPEFLIIPTPSGISDDPEPPRLLAAAVDPQQHHSGSDDEGDDRGRGTHRGLGMDILGGIDRNPSPRKGRNRTGTMIFSEAHIMAEELGKGAGSPSPEREPAAHASSASTDAPETEGDFVRVDVSSRVEEEELSEEQHRSHFDLPTEDHHSGAYDLDRLETEGEHMSALSDVRAHVEAIQDQDHQAPEQDVTEDDDDDDDDDDEGTVAEHADEAPEHEHDVTSAHEASGTTIIELSPADEIDSVEEDAQEEDLTEAVVEPHDDEDGDDGDDDEDDDDAADAREVAEQIASEGPQEQPDGA
ncbi:Mob1/phocein [Russula earlei]|uniref:Mob1/phocein n=1 Tax=Russula earlei TaxID=71964 RepID=A0ACC0UFC2_9AGAM|nr:Mob1/phocein [Russula earlei]